MAPPMSDFHARHYSSNELIQMKVNLPVVRFLVTKLNKHPDIAEILRIPKDAFDNPESYFGKSGSLVDLKNRSKANISSRTHAGRGMSEEIEEHASLAANPTRDSQRVQWNLRPCDSSDHSSQPHSAPGGAAHQSENFQRFYRAVVSPTHVRVTAGGRIVPNTRATAPSHLEGNSGKIIFKPRKSSSDVEIQPLGVAPSLSSRSLSPGFSQLLAGGILPSYNYNAQLSGYPLATMATQSLGTFAGNDNAPVTNGESTCGTLHPANLLQPIKISPPSLFDHSKPFVLNGNLICPVPPGYQPPSFSPPFPFTMIGNPNLSHSFPPPAGYFIPQPPITTGHMSNSAMTPLLDQPSALLIPNLAQPLDGLPAFDPHFPLPGHLSVAELTKVQIEGFHNHLKFINNQIANNKHQIDEKYMENQRIEVMAIIEKMEAMLKIQLAHEAKPDINICLNGIMEPDFDSQLVKNHVNGDARQMPEKYSGTAASALSKEEPSTSYGSIVLQDAPVAQPSTKVLRSEGVQGTEEASDTQTSNRSEPASKSRLTAAAAMAPPFQPRTQAMVAANSFCEISSVTPQNPAQLNAQTPNEGRVTDSHQSSHSPRLTETGHANLLGAHASHGLSIYTQNETLSAVCPQVHAIYNQGAASCDPAISAVSPTAVPYLVGTLPQGVHSSVAQGADLQYPRPLTDEELRARYLYWGKASRLAHSGLPKFDGKDFYPPSPSKEMLRPDLTSSKTKSNINSPSTPIALNFEKLFISPESPTYKTPSPGHQAQYRESASVSPTRVVVDNGIIGFGSPSPGSSRNKCDAPDLPELSTDYQLSVTSKNKSGLRPVIDQSKAICPDEDFSELSLERSAPWYKSPGLLCLGGGQFDLDSGKEVDETPNSLGRAKSHVYDKDQVHSTETSEPWGVPLCNSKRPSESTGLVVSVGLRNGVESTAFAIGLPLAPEIKAGSRKRALRDSSTSRNASLCSSEQQTLFLQNMLKRNGQAGMAAPALRTVFSATAQGYLPQYHGSAAASLAPAMFSIPTPERGGVPLNPKTELSIPTVDCAIPLNAANCLAENQPLNRNGSPRLIQPLSDAPGCEGYMPYLSQKADEDKRIIDQVWNSSTNAAGPVMSSDW